MIEWSSLLSCFPQKRPSSAQSTESDGYIEGFKAGVKAEHQLERIKHKASITHSEEVIKKGISYISDPTKNIYLCVSRKNQLWHRYWLKPI